MAHPFPSKQWTDAFKDAVNANETYRSAGAEWTHGAVAMVVAKGSAPGLEDDVAMLLDVDRGQCRGTQFLQGLDSVKDAPFIIVAPYERWRSVIEGEIDPIKGMMQGMLKLTKGHLPTMLKYVEASRQLVVSASHVPTDFDA